MAPIWRKVLAPRGELNINELSEKFGNLEDLW
jgi:hypothetical protein